MVAIRSEGPGDGEAIRHVHLACFPSDAEANLVDQLRQRSKACVSLVAEDDGRLVGHVVFSPVTTDLPAEAGLGVGLAPLAVIVSHRSRGIGARLVEEGLAACRRAGYPFVVVLGEPRYYRRFGFLAASETGLGNEYGVVDEFMIIALRPGGLPLGGGTARFGPEFAVFGG